MHEMSLAEGVREIVEDAARDQDFDAVRRLVLEIGELAAVEVEALRFCLEVVLRGTIAEGATVDIEPVPGRGWCPDCGEHVPMAQRYDPCPFCDGLRVEVRSGTELRVKSLEAVGMQSGPGGAGDAAG